MWNTRDRISGGSSIPEIIDSGVNGFVVQSLEEAVEAVDKVQDLNRTRCREVFEKRFSSVRMTNDYIKVYERLLAQKIPRRQLGSKSGSGATQQVPLAASGKS